MTTDDDEVAALRATVEAEKLAAADAALLQRARNVVAQRCPDQVQAELGRLKGESHA